MERSEYFRPDIILVLGAVGLMFLAGQCSQRAFCREYGWLRNEPQHIRSDYVKHYVDNMIINHPKYFHTTGREFLEHDFLNDIQSCNP